MNFFGHATVASWYRSSPAFVLGAMLPDFAAMLGGAAFTPRDAELESGVALHHATDAAFHSIREFVDLVSAARAALSAAGLGRGPSRAAAHIGVELLLDEILAEDRGARSAYFSALDYATTSEVAVEWRAPHERARFGALMSSLVRAGLPEAETAPGALARRLRLALRGRPRLAFPESEEPAVSHWVVRARPGVLGCTPTILNELRERLLATGFLPQAGPDSGANG